ncbi:MAG: inorganic diphosphatase, partial [Lachnospiraceae bacterium]|nr:inorganic diphosphatase [Lachnospiraceae bacterium]
VDIVFYMVTSIPKQGTRLLFAGEGSEEIVQEAFGVKPVPADGAHAGVYSVFLPAIVSRKKQLIPPVREKLLE